MKKVAQRSRGQIKVEVFEQQPGIYTTILSVDGEEIEEESDIYCKEPGKLAEDTLAEFIGDNKEYTKNYNKDITMYIVILDSSSGNVYRVEVTAASVEGLDAYEETLKKILDKLGIRPADCTHLLTDSSIIIEEVFL